MPRAARKRELTAEEAELEAAVEEWRQRLPPSKPEPLPATLSSSRMLSMRVPGVWRQLLFGLFVYTVFTWNGMYVTYFCLDF